MNIKGILISDQNYRLFLVPSDCRKKIQIFPGQYLYLAVKKVWIPVRLHYSTQSQKWFFEGMPELNIYMQKVMIKN